MLSGAECSIMVRFSCSQTNDTCICSSNCIQNSINNSLAQHRSVDSCDNTAGIHDDHYSDTELKLLSK